MTKNNDEFVPLDSKERVLLPYLGLDFRSARKRILDFKEVIIPFDEERAKYEAQRCIECPDAPCVEACPIGNDIPNIMALIMRGKFLEAAGVFRKTSNMPDICGRICPQEVLCQGSCVLNHTGEPVLIGALEAFVADHEKETAPMKIDIASTTGKQIAVIGGGPAGITCAEQLRKLGHSVVIFEGQKELGGLLTYGIPKFKISSKIVLDKIDQLKKMGIEIKTNSVIGIDKTIDDLLQDGFNAIFIAVGAGVDSPIKLPGEDLPGIYKATEFLIRANVDHKNLAPELHSPPEVGEKTVVIGGGDTSADCLRTAMRLGSKEVTCLYRRTENEMPGGTRDRAFAKEEGVNYMFLTQPTRFIAGEDGRVVRIECIKMKLCEADEWGRRKPVPIEGSEFTIDTDTVVLAVGYQPYAAIGESTPGLETHKWGLIVVEPETCATTRKGIYAGGDAVNGPDLVVTAMANAFQAASAIDAYLKEN
jgi:glutamate synthase (NADPH/NADH) small chain